MAPLADDSGKAGRAAAIAQALANPARLRLVAALCLQERDAEALGALVSLRPAQVTRLLRPLVTLGLVAAVHAGRPTRYRVAEPALHGLVACMEDCAGRRLRPVRPTP
jgi:DNA-binding transcriptional ArsR family regulator